jgi:ribosomal protein L29
MAILKSKEIVKMNKEDIREKIKELSVELIKARIALGKAGKANLREIKRTIARLSTFRNKIRNEKIKSSMEAKNKK